MDQRRSTHRSNDRQSRIGDRRQKRTNRLHHSRDRRLCKPLSLLRHSRLFNLRLLRVYDDTILTRHPRHDHQYASAFKFTKDHNCEPARTPAQIAAENKRVGDGIQQKLNEALRKIEADLIRNGGMSEVEKKRYDDAREVVRVALGGTTGAGGGGGGRKHVQLDRPGPQAQRQQVRVA